MTDRYPALFQPFALKDVTLRNRFVMPPMTRNFSPGGVPGENVATYYARRAAAEVALCITEGIGIDHPSAIGAGTMAEANVPVLHGDSALAGWRTVVEAVHAAGGLIMPQLWHMGPIRRAGTGPTPEARSMRPSAHWGPRDRAMLPPPYLVEMAADIEPMSDGDIADVIAAFARSAANARSVGFDGIAIHGAHGYLIDSFLWAGTNYREDGWGGSLAARARFGVEVIRAIRAAVGPSMPIVFRYSQWKIHDYGAMLAETPDELAAILTPLAEAGVDLFEASTRIYDTPAFPGSDMTLAGWTKKLTGKAVAAVGGVGLSKDLQSSFTGETATVDNLDGVARRIEAGEFDLIETGRSLIMDPGFVWKVKHNAPFAPFRLEAYQNLY